MQPVSLLKPGDRLRLTVVGFPDLSGEQMVMANGSIQVPYAGSLNVYGLTPEQSVDKIIQALLPYIRRPKVNLAVLNLRPPRVSVTGEVLRPGPFIIIPPQPINNNPQDTAGGDFQTLSYALTLAGGITPDADLRNIIIRRHSPQIIASGNLAAPKSEVKVNLWQVIQTGDLAADPRIYDGDEIVVPKAQMTGNDQQRLLSSTLAPVKITVQVAGEVQKPGPVQIVPTGGLSAAVAAAGGPTERAQMKSIRLLRVSPDGKLERREYAFGDDTGPLRDGDVILVQESKSRRTLDTLGRILGPIAPLLYLIPR
jgi:polysaccharide export outer membrane protein